MNVEAAISPAIAAPNGTPLIYKILLLLALMSVMGGLFTGIMTYSSIGYTDTFLTDWLSAFLLAAVTVMPAGFFIMTLLTALAAKLLPGLNEQQRNLVIGVSMAVIMESLLALTTAFHHVGFIEPVAFLNAWFNGLIAALPVALLAMVTITMTIKPKIERFLKR